MHIDICVNYDRWCEVISGGQQQGRVEDDGHMQAGVPCATVRNGANLVPTDDVAVGCRHAARCADDIDAQFRYLEVSPVMESRSSCTQVVCVHEDHCVLLPCYDIDQR